MKRPLFVIGSTYALTTWVAFLLGFSLRHTVLLSGALAATGALLLTLRQRKLARPCLILLSAALALGGYSAYSLKHLLPYENLGGQVVEVQGVIQTATVTDGRSAYTVNASFISRDDLPVNKEITVYAYGDTLGKPGETVRCLVKLYPTGGTSITLAGTLQGIPHTVQDDAFSLQRSMIRLRQGMWQNLSRNLPPETAEIAGAVVLGLNNQVSSDVYTAVNRSGTSHLLAVSGLHLSILTNLVLLACRKARMPRGLSYLLAVGAGFLFASLTAFRPSIMRAFLMLAVMSLGQILSRDNDPLTALGAALLVICILRPHWVLTTSLWLSVTSTLGLLLYADPLMARINKRIPERSGRLSRFFLRFMLGAGAVSVSAYVFSAPVLFVTSGWISLVSPLANMLVAPFVPLLLLSGFLCAGGFLPPALLGIAVKLCRFCTAMVLGLSRLFAGLPFVILSLDAAYLLILVAATAAGLVVLHRWGWKKDLVAYSLVCLVLAYSAGNLSYACANRHTVELVRLESGTTLLLRGGEAVILGMPPGYGDWRLQQYLDFRGINHISLVVATGYPAQIGSGMLDLHQRYGIGCVLAPDDAYIVDMLTAALPGTQVLPGGYATATSLDGAVIVPQGEPDAVAVQVGRSLVLKSEGKYAIITRYGHAAQLFPDGIYLPEGMYPQLEPVGGHLFGETRVLLDTGGTVPVLR